MPGEPVTSSSVDIFTPPPSPSPPPPPTTVPPTFSVRYSDGSVYEGELVNGVPAGHGICVFASGTVCVGHFAAGQLEGRAEVLQAGGALFLGNFRHSAAHGSGAFLISGRIIRGRWERGEMISRAAEGEVMEEERVRRFAPVAISLCRHLRHLLGTNEGQGRQYIAGSGKINEPIIHIGGYHDHNMTHYQQEHVQNSPPELLLMSREPTFQLVSQEAPTRAPSQAPIIDLAKTRNGLLFDMEGSFINNMTRRRLANLDNQQQDKLSGKNIISTGASPQAIFASAAPAANEFFSMIRFIKYWIIFLFPFLSLPQFPFSPIRRAILDMEREFVVSGAPLLREFDPPVGSLYFTTIAMACHIAAIVIVAVKVRIGNASEGYLSLEEMTVPCVLWITHAGICAGYSSYIRVAHAIERLDRRLTPKLSTFAAGLVDTKAKVCIYTWDDEGRSTVTNMHYRYRWLVTSITLGIIMSFAAPLTRAGFHHSLFGNNKYEMAASILVFFSNLLFSSTLVYYIMKMTDMQRQILEQMRVLTRLVYLEDKSMMKPSEYLTQRFNFEEPLGSSDVFTGVIGWSVVRSLVLYAATCSNHAARSSAMSIYFVLVIFGFLVICGDFLYMLIFGYENTGTYFTAWHSYAILLCTAWGFMLLRYLYICTETISEHSRHLYLLDVAALYHQMKHRSIDGSGEMIVNSRRMIKEHEQLPCIFSVRTTPLFLAAVVFLHIISLALVILDLYFVIHNRK